jgi:hypothetical protein
VTGYHQYGVHETGGGSRRWLPQAEAVTILTAPEYSMAPACGVKSQGCGPAIAIMVELFAARPRSAFLGGPRPDSDIDVTSIVGAVTASPAGRRSDL